ncbi:helix-turn-helix domain-containing protein [Companilactobacillus hulinensis]|uniref:helix-turn-helix domain-containing protein n=1 Tax=Companilactobacillus hulinensis TaxID=2486007 RepID=UPI000F7A582C|nr:helix-turn-helix transcriptional regulator [Companilactobacillus hulinensis]
MFKDALKQLRIDQGISQEKLGEILDVSRQSISKYESGLSEPDFDKLIMIAEYFDVTTDFLLMSKINNQIKTRSERISISSKMGETSDDLQYYVNLKSKGLDYVIDDN